MNYDNVKVKNRFLIPNLMIWQRNKKGYRIMNIRKWTK